MAIQVTPDHPQSLEIETFDGLVAERVFTVTGLSGASSSILTQARTASGIPNRLDAHPSIAGLVALEKRVRGMNESTAQVSVRYEPPTPEEAPELGGQYVTVDSTSVREQTLYDINNNRLKVVYSIVRTQLPVADVDRSRVTVTYTVFENVAEEVIAQRAIDYAESVNDAEWAGWPAKTWKIDDIQSRPHGKFRKWLEVQTVMTYNPLTWQFNARYVEDGATPEDASQGDGFALFDVRQPTDFTLLPLTPVQKLP